MSFKRKLLHYKAAACIAAVLLASCTMSVVYAANVSETRNITVIAQNSAPIPQNHNFATYRGVVLTGQLQATDPEGDMILYRLASLPEKGSVTVCEDGYFQYMPFEGKKGVDRFTFVTEDAWGNRSDPASVTITINKQKTDVSYSDMKDHDSHYAALRLAEKGIFTGEKIGDEYIFSPDASVTRGMFLTLCLRLTDIDTDAYANTSAFSDEDMIPVWMTDCVAAGQRIGITTGYPDTDGKAVFHAESDITVSEAIVMLDRALNVTDVHSTKYASFLETADWSYQSTVNLAACGVLPVSGFADYDVPLTRGEMAVLLSGALDILEAREK